MSTKEEKQKRTSKAVQWLPQYMAIKKASVLKSSAKLLQKWKDETEKNDQICDRLEQVYRMACWK